MRGNSRSGDVTVQISPRRPCAGLGADRGIPQGTPAMSRQAITRTRPIPPARRSKVVPCEKKMCSSPRPRFACRCFVTAIAGMTKSKSAWPRSRCSRSGALILWRLLARQAQRVDSALLCVAGYDRRLSARRDGKRIARYYESPAWRWRPAHGQGPKKADRWRTIRLRRPRPHRNVWTRRFPDPVTAFAYRAGCGVAPAPRRVVSERRGDSDHGSLVLTDATINATGAAKSGSPMGPGIRALVNWWARPWPDRALALISSVTAMRRRERRPCQTRTPRHEPLRRTARSPRLRAGRNTSCGL